MKNICVLCYTVNIFRKLFIFNFFVKHLQLRPVNICPDFSRCESSILATLLLEQNHLFNEVMALHRSL